jgi:hypothetical protein
MGLGARKTEPEPPNVRCHVAWWDPSELSANRLSTLGRMSNELGYTCGCCGEYHPELPMSYGADAPCYWLEEFAADAASMLNSDLCVIKGEHYFVRGVIEIPVLGGDDVHSWGVWASLSEPNFKKTIELVDAEGREAEPSYFGWLSTELPIYEPTTVSLKTHVHTRPVGQRPWIELEPTAHPLAIEQREGISLDRVREIAQRMLHL